jgi:hypothetical protein
MSDRYKVIVNPIQFSKKGDVMGEFWDKLKTILGFGVPGSDAKDDGTQGFKDRILNADRHKFKSDEPEPQPAE